MQSDSSFFSCMTPRSMDTIETLVNKQRMYESTNDISLGTIYPCSNLQKKNTTGLTGIMTEFKGDTILHTLDSITDNIFSGISVVRCNISENNKLCMGEGVINMQKKLDSYMKSKESNIGVVLEKVLPNKESMDFWWLGQSCEFKGCTQTKDCIFHDNKTASVNFYDAYTCVENHDENENIDRKQRDGCVWDPLLRGSIGIYAQENDKHNDLFFVCVSDFASVASDIVRSIKSDIGTKTNIFDFCSSKEMWFLNNISRRNRLRLILEVSNHLGLSVDKQYDMYANESVADPCMAIEVCGIDLNHTDCFERMDTCTGKITQSVCFYQSCVDARKQNSIIPVYLGDSTGLILFMPQKLNDKSFAIYTESAEFVNNSVQKKSYLCPVTNVVESEMSNVKKIQNENKNLTYLTIEDILYDMNLNQNLLDSSFVQVLKSKNEYGESLFYGVRHDTIKSLVIIYPKCVASFIQSMSTIEYQSVPSEVQTLTKQSKKDPKAPERYSTMAETMCKDFVMQTDCEHIHTNLFGFEDEKHKEKNNQTMVSLEWDDSVISNMQSMSMMNNHKIDTLKIVPIIFYKNYTH